MNKRNILRLLVAVAAIIATITATVNIDQLPENWKEYAGIAVVALLGIKEIVVIIGDLVDDGKRNNSFKP